MLELQKQAKLKDDVIFSAQGASKKSLETYFHVKLKNKLGLLSSLFSILAFLGLINAFFVILHLKWQKGPKNSKRAKNAYFRPKSKKRRKSGLNLFFDFVWKYFPKFSWGAPWAEKMTLSFIFAYCWTSDTFSLNQGIMWRQNQKRKTASNFFWLSLPNGEACSRESLSSLSEVTRQYFNSLSASSFTS